MSPIPHLIDACLPLLLVVTLSACIAPEPPLPPEHALELAAARIDAVLAAHPRVPSGGATAIVNETGAVDLWYCAHPILAPVLSYPEWQADLREHHAGVDRTIDTQYLGDWSVGVQKLTVNLAVGEPPDIALVDRGWLAALAHAGRLLPLDELVDPDLIADLRPAFRDTLSLNDRLYGLPADGFVSLMYARDGALDAAPVKTWDDLRDISARLVSASPRTYPLGYFPFEEALWSAGGDICNASGALLRRPEAKEALEFVVGLRMAAAFHPGTWRSPLLGWQAFQRGQAVMTVASSAYEPQVQAMRDAAIVAPVPGKSGPITRLSGFALVVFAQHDPAKRPTLAAILDYLTGAAVQGQSALAKGSLPVRESVARSIALPHWDAVLEHARNTPLVAPLSAVENEMNRSLARAYAWAEKQ